MEFLSSIGFIVVIVSVIYFVIRLQSFTDDEYIKVHHLIKYCDECAKYKDETARHTPSKFVKKEVVRILSNPKTRERATKRKKEAEDEKLMQEKDYEKSNQENRKFAYQYEEAIFSVFDTDYQLCFNELTDRIRIHYQFQSGDNDILKIFMYWNIKNLITNVQVNDLYGLPKEYNSYDWKISYILTDPRYKLVPSDLTWNEWLVNQGKLPQ